MQIIDLLLLNQFHPVISYRQVRMESDELFYTVWSLVTVRNQLPVQVVNLYACREFFIPKLQYFPDCKYIKYNPSKRKITNLVLINNFYPVISYRRVRKKKKATNYFIRFGHSLRSAISCQCNWLIFFDLSLLSKRLQLTCEFIIFLT